MQCKRKQTTHWHELYQNILDHSPPHFLIEDVAPELLVYTYALDSGYKWFCENCVYSGSEPYASAVIEYHHSCYLSAVQHIEEKHPIYFFAGLYDD